MILKDKFPSLLIFFIENAIVFTKGRALQRGPSKRPQYAIFKVDLIHALDVSRVVVLCAGNKKIVY